MVKAKVKVRCIIAEFFSSSVAQRLLLKDSLYGWKNDSPKVLNMSSIIYNKIMFFINYIYGQKYTLNE